MARTLMPKSGIMMPYVVVSRDAAVVGVSTVDGKAGAIDLTTTYRKITDSYAKTETYTKTEVDNLITPIMTGALFKADPFVNNNIPLRSGGANGVTSINLIKANTDNSIHIGDTASGVQGVHLFSEGRIDVTYKNDAGVDTVAPMYSKRYRPEVVDMPFAAVGDYVLDSQGRTIAVNRTGINSDLKILNALTNINSTNVIFERSPTIPDGAHPYDAVNLRQLQAAGGGGGASMNGVMNNFIGAVEWFNGSRAKLPAGYIVADGQEESQTDPKTSDLYAAVNAGMFVTVTEALWQNSGNADTLRAGENRGAYVKQSSTGKFRVPDLNGASADGKSPRANFLRGDGGGLVTPEIGGVGAIKYNAAPNITGSSGNSYMTGAGNTGTGGYGAVRSTVSSDGLWTPGGGAHYANDSFDASLSNGAYGRGSEIRPNSVTGIWIIRANGAFQASNTRFRTIQGDATTPAVGTTTYAGSSDVVYQVAGVDKYTASLGATYKWGDPHSSAIIQSAITGGEFFNYYFDSNGYFRNRDSSYRIGMSDGVATLRQLHVTNTGIVQVDPISPQVSNYIQMTNVSGNPSSGAYVSQVQGGWYSDYWIAGGCRGGGSNLQSYKIQITNTSASGWWEFLHDASGRIGTIAGYITPAASDIRLKNNVSDIEAGSLERIKQIKSRDFEWKSDGRKDRGFIAQELAEVDSRYVFAGGGEDPDQPLLNVSQPAIISDLVATVQSLIGQVEDLKAEVAALKSNTK